MQPECKFNLFHNLNEAFLKAKLKMNFLDKEASYKATHSFWQLQLLKMGAEKVKICQSAESAWQNS